MEKIRLHWRQFWEDKFDESQKRFTDLVVECCKLDFYDVIDRRKATWNLRRQWVELKIQKLCLLCLGES